MNNLSPEDQQALDALRNAVAEELERKRRLGQYAVVWRNGQPIRLDGDADRSLPPTFLRATHD